MTFARRGTLRTAALAGSFLGLLLLLACGKQPPAPLGGAVTIELSLPTTVLLPLTPGVKATITATVYDPFNQGVIWTVTPLNFGTLSAQTSTNQPADFQTVASVTYATPKNFTANTTVTLTATSVSNPNVSASLPIPVSPITVSLQLFSNFQGNDVQAGYAQTLGPGQQLVVAGVVLPTTVASTLTWSLSPADAGSLTNQIGNQITYTAPNSISSPLTASVTATSTTDTSATNSMQITVLPSGAGPNVAAVKIDGGPVPGQFHPNAAFTSVTICNPMSTLGIVPCQNVDGILVDTGSYGLRVLQSQIPLLKLTTLADGNDNTLENCASQVDGSYLWGPVSRADVYIAGDVATNALIQVITSANVVVPDGCSNGGTDLNTAQLLGANGILGIGPEPTDCTLAGVNYCDGSTTASLPNLYFACPSVGCATTDTPVVVPGGLTTNGSQVVNPISVFTVNNLSGTSRENNIALQLPGVSGTETSLVGTLTFLTNAELSGVVSGATVFDLDSHDHFTTFFNGQTLTGAFLDSGSNAFYFPDSLRTCSVNPQFYCPASTLALSAVNEGKTGAQSTVNFTVDNADSLLSGNPDNAALSTLAGPIGTYKSCSDGNISCTFDWGLPFFFGRTVYEFIDCPGPPTCSTPQRPFWAY